jgi:DUF4097 and DUF4098 domain-containing protein YvlB
MMVATRLGWLGLSVLTSLGSHPPADDFQWSGRIAAGKTIEIVGVNGDIDATGATGGQVEVTATKRARHSDPDDVEIKVVEHEGGVTICALYPSRHGRTNECLPGGRGRNDTKNNDVRVHFTVRVPAGVRFAGRTVNGDVDARGLTAPALARTVNGSITVETGGYAEANTVNGSIDATVGQANWDGALEFETVNGSITLALPGQVNADVEARTVNGSISTDFPLTIKGRWGPRRLHGTLGDGGRTLSFATVNGDIELRKTK